MVFQDAGELRVGSGAGAFAFETYDQGFAGVVVEAVSVRGLVTFTHSNMYMIHEKTRPTHNSVITAYRSLKYLFPVKLIGNTLCTNTNASLFGSYGVGTCTLRSKNRTPFLNCSRGLTA